MIHAPGAVQRPRPSHRLRGPARTRQSIPAEPGEG
jgi:hypothetical protein